MNRNPNNIRGDVQVLDCTLRDGGYYCDWDFEDSTVRRYIDAVILSGVQYLEIGFRSRGSKGFAGKFKFCSDELVESLIRDESIKVAVMIDGKDFIQDGEVAHDDLSRLFLPKSKSRIDIVRITASPPILDSVVQMSAILDSLGYTVSVNLMQASVLSDQAISEIAGALDESAAAIMYVADSFGGLSPSRTTRLFEILRDNFSRRLGFHGHDNLGLALANSIAAMEAGADLIDSSLRGMGRGPGNLRTEQLLFYMCFELERNDFDVAPLFDIVSTEFGELHDRHGWGMSLPYMLSGVYNLHPMYAQRLLQGVRYSSIEVIRTLESLHRSGSGSQFHIQELTGALRNRFSEIATPLQVTALPGYRGGFPIPRLAKTRPVLLLASGASLCRHADAINEFIRKLDPFVIECNAHEEIAPGQDHYCIFTNTRRLEKFGPIVERSRRNVILGMPTIDETIAGYLQEKELYRYSCEIQEGKFGATRNGCVIPHDVVAMAALALCAQTNARMIFLCGVDGYGSKEINPETIGWDERISLNREMEIFFGLFKENPVSSATKLISLTPTLFDLETESIYAYL